VFGNKVVMEISESKKDDVSGQLRMLHKEELCGLHRSPSIVRTVKLRRLQCTVHADEMGETRNRYKMLVGKPLGNWPLVRPRKWEDNIETNLKGIGYENGK
jgi:hypothetical protein